MITAIQLRLRNIMWVERPFRLWKNKWCLLDGHFVPDMVISTFWTLPHSISSAAFWGSIFGYSIVQMKQEGTEKKNSTKSMQLLKKKTRIERSKAQLHSLALDHSLPSSETRSKSRNPSVLASKRNNQLHTWNRNISKDECQMKAKKSVVVKRNLSPGQRI